MNQSSSSNNNNNNNKSRTSSTAMLLQNASKSLTQSLSTDLPLLMYGSGDVQQQQQQQHNNNNNNNIDDNTTSLLATYTSTFIYDLVTAAIDSHDIYTKGNNTDGGGIVPIPNFNYNNIQSTIGNTTDDDNNNGNNNDEKEERSSSSTIELNTNRKKRQSRDWDDELPIPIIIQSDQLEQQEQQDQQDQQDATSHYYNNHKINHHQWQGAIGLDISSNEIRSKYLSSTNTINEKSFLLPIYHDQEMYHRSKEILSFHNNAMDVLFDSGVKQFINEGMNDLRRSYVDGWMNDNSSRAIGNTNNNYTNTNTNTNDRERQRKENTINDTTTGGSDGEDVMDVLNWPGMDFVLPTHHSRKSFLP